MLTKMPVAPLIETSSSKGEVIAIWAASIARFSPLPKPEPMRARPMPVMIERTSAKSTLMRPGTITRSLMPRTAVRHTLSTMLKDSRRVRFLPARPIKRSLGITMSASTDLASSAMPLVAFFLRWSPSNMKGLVTTPTVSAPISRAARAMTGAAPVPVPPPMPAVTNTMSAPPNTSPMRWASSRAAAHPMSGLAPAPSPLVRVLPI